jgi:putative addiction module component (TIGR02574 family)
MVIVGETIMPTLQELGLDRLSPEDRLSLAEALWESVIVEEPDSGLAAGQRAELERRYAESVAAPGVGSTWDEVKQRALARSRR